MNTFPMSEGDYSVEEISYDDMMSILSTQGNTGSQPEQSERDESAEAALQLPQSLQSLQSSSAAGKLKPVNDKPVSKEEELAQRLTENANQSLPEWLLNR